MTSTLAITTVLAALMVSSAAGADVPHGELGIRTPGSPTPSGDVVILDRRVAISPRLAIGAYGWSTRLRRPELEVSHTLATATLHVAVAPRLDLRLGAGLAAARHQRSEIVDLDGPVPDLTGTRVHVWHELQPALVAGLSARVASSASHDIDVVAVLGGSMGPDDEPIYRAVFALRLAVH